LKSILKKTSFAILPFSDVDVNKRESTPEPADPLSDPSYLESPFSRILAKDASLRDVVEAYSVLTARIKPALAGATDVDASWPLFQPMRQNISAIANAIIRDISRATEALPSSPPDPEQEREEQMVLLPSPEKSPKKKKGMSAEQVKHARDLCNASHAALKFVAVVFTNPAVYRVFSGAYYVQASLATLTSPEDDQLGAILTEVLAIPLATELPTPNARKTWALSIWLLQVQRLPAEVLIPARDRITYALRRGIEGELGKEGKKGSASDGLKV
jgi:hypothetical protein